MTKLSALADASLNDTDQLYINDGGASRKCTVAQLRTALASLQNVVEDTTPALGGNLDVSTFAVVDANGNELFKFTATASAVNEFTVANNATGSGPTLSASGGDTNIDINVTPKGSGTTNFTTGGINVTGAITVSSTVDGRDVAADGSKLDTIASSATANPNALDNVSEDTTPTLGGNLDLSSYGLVDASGNEQISFTSTASAVNEITVINAATGTGPIIDATGDDTNIDLRLDAKGSGLIKTLKGFDVTGNITVSGTVDGRDLAADGSKLDNITANAIADLVEDTSPQLGGQLDVNGNAIGDGTLELITFSETASAVNQVNVKNNITGSAPVISAAGDDTNIDLMLAGKGSGQVKVTATAVASQSQATTGTNNNVLMTPLRTQQQIDANEVTFAASRILGARAGDTAYTALTTAQAKTLTGYITDVVNDTTPQLGGNLDVNSNSIVSTSNGDITLTPNGTGNVTLGSFTFDADQTVGAGQDNYVLTYDNGTGLISLESAAGGGGGASTALDNLASVAINTTLVSDTDNTDDLGTATARWGAAYAVNVRTGTTATNVLKLQAYDVDGVSWTDFITLTANNTPTCDLSSSVTIGSNTIADTSSSQTLTNKTINTASNTITVVEADISDLGSYITDVVSDTTPQLGGNLDVNGNSLVSTANGNITLTPNGTGNVVLGSFTFDADQTVGAGQDNYVMTYDNGTGLISLEASAGGGLSNVVEDTTPQLGGDLDAQGNNITSLGVVFMTEQAAADADVAGDGQWWVKSDTPNTPWFTNDAGTDFQLATLAGTETLTNKTIAAANNTLSIATTDLSDASALSGTSAQIVVYNSGWTAASMSGDATIATSGAITLTATNTNLTTLANVTTVGVLTAGSIGSGFGTISTGNAITTTADVTGASLIATGDTAASDSAAIGYTATEGIIITGQGSTNDVTIKNDADTAVINIPTGTTNVDVVGDLSAGTITAPVDISTETTGTLTSSSLNKTVQCTGNITLPNSGYASGDIILIDPGGTARTITRPATHTMYIADTDSATGTTSAHNIVTAMYHGSSKWTLQGAVT